MSSISADSVQCRPPPVFSKEQIKQIRTTVLSLIRDMVTAPDFIPSSVGPIIDACATSLPAAEFTALLQESNITGHTPLYWAVVNNRPEALSAFLKFIATYTYNSLDDLRLACMATSNHAWFTSLKLTTTPRYRKGLGLNRSLGYPRDKIQVYHEGNLQNQFTSKIQIMMFQKRMRVTQEIYVELIAQGRIWCLLFYMGVDTKWRVSFGLAKDSLPARPKALLKIEAQNEQSQDLQINFEPKEDYLLAPEGYTNSSIHTCESLSASLDDVLMFNDAIYTDSDGALHANLEVTLL
ncbi:hypothetical protein DFJ58DRAFT_753148 [Suillus subalutaceus]|uniref:uncharacterized protein n=1 Tax=Suillus subalutaceus TaxID=48586 RepID=UPI001B86ED13|nr:uncharacterized protein DFJ58DRAFT_753148 [Suillus subalutaceus]KAG1877895.1 hypothetical protein DFJ58DRAFT_753148 [Suillus subalutaceus]